MDNFSGWLSNSENEQYLYLYNLRCPTYAHEGESLKEINRLTVL